MHYVRKNAGYRMNSAMEKHGARLVPETTLIIPTIYTRIISGQWSWYVQKPACAGFNHLATACNFCMACILG
jgi:hypothetical protein